MRYSVKMRLKNMIRVFGMELPDVREVLGRHAAQIILLYCRLSYTHIIENAITGGRLGAIEKVVEAFVVRCRSVEPENADERLVVDNLLIDANRQAHPKGLTTPTVFQCFCPCPTSHRQGVQIDGQLRVDIAASILLEQRQPVHPGPEPLGVVQLRVSIGATAVHYHARRPQNSSVAESSVTSALQTFSNLIALQSQGYAGMLKGPAATGKSETIKELARVLGKHCEGRFAQNINIALCFRTPLRGFQLLAGNREEATGGPPLRHDALGVGPLLGRVQPAHARSHVLGGEPHARNLSIHAVRYNVQ